MGLVMETKFNFKSQMCTTVAQSERLLALSLKKETADMNYTRLSKGDHWTLFIGLPMGYDEIPNEYLLPAWSLHRLIEMMPFDVIPEGGFDNCFTLIKNYPKGYSVEYDGFSYYYKENIYDTLIDAIEHLIKEGYFNKEYLV
jgi:hypothetical protein